MTLPSSGPITINGIKVEFEGTTPISLSSYYKGGSLVNAAVTAPIPTSGPISMSNFYGASQKIAPPVSVGSAWFTSVYGGASPVGSGTTLLTFTTTFPNNYFATTWQQQWMVDSSAGYDYMWGEATFLRNGVVMSKTYNPQSPNYGNLAYSWYRDQSTSVGNNSAVVTLTGGDTVTVYLQAIARISQPPIIEYARQALVRIS